MDGTPALNQTNLSVINQTITNWPPGAALWLVWQMTDSTGKAQGLGMDNLSFSANTAPPPVPVPLDIQFSGTRTCSWHGPRPKGKATNPNAKPILRTRPGRHWAARCWERAIR